MPRLNPGTIVPAPEEDTAIAAGIAVDENARELDDVFFSRAESASQALPRIMAEEAAATLLKRRGRKPGTNNKVATNLRLDPDLLEAFKATGEGWQTRMNDALRDWCKKHRMLAR